MGEKSVLKVFDANGIVQEHEIIFLSKVLSYKNVTIFFYENDSFQVMVNNEPVFCSGK